MRKAIEGIRSFLITLHPVRFVVLGYISYILLGCFLLCLPFAQRGTGARVIDNLFVATSAVSTTGLVTVPASCLAAVNVKNLASPVYAGISRF